MQELKTKLFNILDLIFNFFKRKDKIPFDIADFKSLRNIYKTKN